MSTSNFVSRDILNLSNNVECQKMLQKLGDNFPEQEKVILSLELTKINKRGKNQNRILLLTDKALYNLKPKELRKCQRRIDLDKIVSITASSVSNEFALHIPEEYDYRYKSHQYKDVIIRTISELHRSIYGKNITIKSTKQESTEQYIVPKHVARVQTREERLKRYRELIGKDTYDDELNDIQQAKFTSIKGLNLHNMKVRANDFEFLKVIGRGSFGKVMQVRKKDDDKIYAMKILKKKVIIDKGQVLHTNAENNILRSLQHPFLMQLRFAFQTDAKLYLVLDYYRGGELFFHLKKKRRFSETQAQFFVAETGMALGHLHSLNIIYRDLKPENILLDHEGHVILTDFGLSKELDSNKDTDELSFSFCGTPEYLAPEIVMNLGHSLPVDWWAIGILLYELCVGIPPFYSTNISEMYKKINSAPLLFPPSLSNPCKDIITKLLDRNPNKRLGSAHADFMDIQKHVFFRNIDWDKLYKKEVVPPYNPKVKGDDAAEPTCFEPIFLNETPKDTPAPVPTIALNKPMDVDGFDGFSYVPAQKKNALINKAECDGFGGFSYFPEKSAMVM